MEKIIPHPAMVKGIEISSYWLVNNPHFFEKADQLSAFMKEFNLSERLAGQLLFISKSEVHRLKSVAETDSELRAAVLKHRTDYWALCKFHEVSGSLKSHLRERIISGYIKRHKQIKALVDSSPARREKRFEKARAELAKLQERVHEINEFLNSVVIV